MSTVRIGVLKLGCIGTLPLLELLFDERAERKDIEILTLGSGAKITSKQCMKVTEIMISQNPDIVILVGPGQTAKGPSQARLALAGANISTVIVSDTPAKKILKEIEELGQGYIIVEADSMIGARREFLDPTEMALFNSDLIRILAITGVFNLITEVIDKIVLSMKNGEKPKLPQIILDGEKSVEAAEFSNPYARSRALASFKMAQVVSELTVEACFRNTDPLVYIQKVAAAHEIMSAAAEIANKARELEKAEDNIMRKPHYRNGLHGKKRKLMEKPKKT